MWYQVSCTALPELEITFTLTPMGNFITIKLDDFLLLFLCLFFFFQKWKWLLFSFLTPCRSTPLALLRILNEKRRLFGLLLPVPCWIVVTLIPTHFLPISDCIEEVDSMLSVLIQQKGISAAALFVSIGTRVPILDNFILDIRIKTRIIIQDKTF